MTSTILKILLLLIGVLELLAGGYFAITGLPGLMDFLDGLGIFKKAMGEFSRTDGEIRLLSGFRFGLGLGFVAAFARFPKNMDLARFCLLVLFCGGLARLYGMIVTEHFGLWHVVPVFIELGLPVAAMLLMKNNKA